MTVYAYTAPGATYPEYINVKVEDDSALITVRSAPTFDVMQSDAPPLAVCGPTAVIRLSLNEAHNLVSDLSAAIHDRDVKRDEQGAG